MSERPKIIIKNSAGERDPRRRPVRGGMSPLPPHPDRDAPGPHQAAGQRAARPPRAEQRPPRQAPTNHAPDHTAPQQPAWQGPANRPPQEQRGARPARTNEQPFGRANEPQWGRANEPQFDRQRDPQRTRPFEPQQDRQQTRHQAGGLDQRQHQRQDQRPDPRHDPRSQPRQEPQWPGQPAPHQNPPRSGRPARVAAARGTIAPMPDANAPSGVRLSKVLSDRGQASRREADDWIAAGWVRVDGRVAQLGQRVRGDERIDIDAHAHQQQQRQVTILLNKPVGFVSGQPEDGHQPAAVLLRPENRWADDRGLTWHPAHLRSLAPAGRLDIDSTGLLVFTQDGRVARHLIGEDSEIEKEYLVRVQPLHEGAFKADDIERLRHGLELDGVRLKPAKVSWANEDQLRFVLREGRKRQLRRMCELVGLSVVGLKRVRIGSVSLGQLPAGQWRYLRDDERF